MTQMTERAVTDRAPAEMIADAIPLIDVAGHLGGDREASRKAATQLGWAFENVGFYYLFGHGVPQSLIDRPTRRRRGFTPSRGLRSSR
jgi:isopenicillin N synthase-like dioxygenase